MGHSIHEVRGEVAIGPSIYGVYVIDGSLCSRVNGMRIYRCICISKRTASLICPSPACSCTCMRVACIQKTVIDLIIRRVAYVTEQHFSTKPSWIISGTRG